MHADRRRRRGLRCQPFPSRSNLPSRFLPTLVGFVHMQNGSSIINFVVRQGK